LIDSKYACTYIVKTREFKVVYHHKQVERLVNKTVMIIQYGSPNLRERMSDTDTVSKVELEK